MLSWSWEPQKLQPGFITTCTFCFPISSLADNPFHHQPCTQTRLSPVQITLVQFCFHYFSLRACSVGVCVCKVGIERSKSSKFLYFIKERAQAKGFVSPTGCLKFDPCGFHIARTLSWEVGKSMVLQ